MLVIVSSQPAALFQFVCPSPDVWILGGWREKASFKSYISREYSHRSHHHNRKMTRVAKRKREDAGGESASNEPGVGGTKKKEEKQDEILVPTNVMLRIASFITGSSSSSELPLAVIIYTGEALNELIRRSKIPPLPMNILSHVADFIRDRKTYNALSMANKEIREALTSKQFMPWPEMRLCEGPSLNPLHYFYHMSADNRWLYRFRFRWHSPEAEEDDNEVGEVKTGNDLDETPWCFRLTKWNAKTGRVMEETELSTVHTDQISIQENWKAFAVWKLVGDDVDSSFHVYRFRNENGVLAFNPEQAVTIQPSLPRVHHNLLLSVHKSERTATALHALDDEGEGRGGIALALYDLESGQEIKHTILDLDVDLPLYCHPTFKLSMISTDQFTLWATRHGRFKIWPHGGSATTSTHLDLGVTTPGVDYHFLFPNPKNPNVIAALGVRAIGNGFEWMHLSSLAVNDPSTITSSRTSHGKLRNFRRYISLRERHPGIRKQPIFGWFPCGESCFFLDEHEQPRKIRIFALASDNVLEELPASKQTPYQTRFRTTVDAIFQKELSREEYLTKVQFEAEGKIVLVANRYGHTYIERLVNE